MIPDLTGTSWAGDEALILFPNLAFVIDFVGGSCSFYYTVLMVINFIFFAQYPIHEYYSFYQKAGTDENPSTQASICFTEFGRRIILLSLSNKKNVGVANT